MDLCVSRPAPSLSQGYRMWHGHFSLSPLAGRGKGAAATYDSPALYPPRMWAALVACGPGPSDSPTLLGSRRRVATLLPLEAGIRE
jgi:hypothetical protein